MKLFVHFIALFAWSAIVAYLAVGPLMGALTTDPLGDLPGTAMFAAVLGSIGGAIIAYYVEGWYNRTFLE